MPRTPYHENVCCSIAVWKSAFTAAIDCSIESSVISIANSPATGITHRYRAHHPSQCIRIRHRRSGKIDAVEERVKPTVEAVA